MCAIEAAKHGKSVILLDHAKKPAEKIRISGGGRCNFINLYQSPEAFISNNPHFCKSALSRFTQHDFIKMVEQHDIAYHEKTLGQLFCDQSSKDIIAMLLQQCKEYGVKLWLDTPILSVSYIEGYYRVETKQTIIQATSLVIATGGLSIPKMGATDFGYQIAKQFGLKVIPCRAGLVPFRVNESLGALCKHLSGLSLDAEVCCGKQCFREGLLFTHRGLSGPSILQISSYWKQGDRIRINLLPEYDIFPYLKEQKQSSKKDIATILGETNLPKRLVQVILAELSLSGRMAEMADKTLEMLANRVHRWEIIPSGTEGYRTAEVTLGGIDTAEISSQTMESKQQPNLYFIGEVVDVTGHLGGFNFGWAWASGFVCGQEIGKRNNAQHTSLTTPQAHD